MKIAPNWSGIAAVIVVGALAGIALVVGNGTASTALLALLGGIVLPQPVRLHSEDQQP